MNEFDVNQLNPEQLEQLFQMGIESAGAETFLLQMLGAFAGGLIIFGILAILTLIALCFMFKKMGNKWYEALVSGHNFYVMIEKAGKPGRWIFFPLFTLIPIVGPFIAIILGLVVWVLVNVGLGNKFGKSGGFILGLVVLPFIFYPILGFGKATYKA